MSKGRSEKREENTARARTSAPARLTARARVAARARIPSRTHRRGNPFPRTSSARPSILRICALSFLTFSLSLFRTPPCFADGFRPVGPEIQFGPNNAWWSNASYNPATNEYLVLWASVSGTWHLRGRCIHATTGQFTGPEFTVASTVGLGCPVFNPHQSSWFVVYHTDHDIGGDIKGQKVGNNGNVGPPITLAQNPSDQQVPAVDYDPVRQRHLVVWADYQAGHPTIRGRFFDQNGATIPGMSELQISDPVPPKAQNVPTVAYNPATSEFLVAWADARNDLFRTNPNENDNNYIDIYGQRVNAVTGQLVGSDVQIHSPFVQGQPYIGDGQDVNGILACNTSATSPMYGTCLLPDQKLTTQFGFTTQGLLLGQQGARYNGMAPIDLSHPLRGGLTGGVYSPGDDVYISSYLDNSFDVSAKVVSAAGQALTSGKVVAHPDYEENFGSLAIRPSDGQCLQVTTLFEHFATHAQPHTLIAQRFIRDAAAPAPVTLFAAQSGSRQVQLTWVNPTDADFSGVTIRYSHSDFPASHAAGTLLVDAPGTPGSAGAHLHADLNPGITYYYSAFAHDDLLNFAPPAQALAVPGGLGDFEPDDDVDQSDFAVLQRCLSGEAIPYAAGCGAADFDVDNDVDAADFNQFLPCMSGAGIPSGC